MVERASAIVALSALLACGDVAGTPGRGAGGEAGAWLGAVGAGGEPAGSASSNAGGSGPGATGAGGGVGGGFNGPVGPVDYPADQLLSPVTEHVAERLRSIAGSGPATDAQVFMKVGASGTVSSRFLDCFGGDRSYLLDLDGRDELMPTVSFFREGDAAGQNPWSRDTLAAVVGKSAVWAIAGEPSPIDQEIDALNPRYALVNYGTNDMQLGETHRSALWPFYENFSRLLDELEEQGIVPIVTGLNPRTDSVTAARWVPTYNNVVRGVAEARQIPFIDLYLASVGLPAQGLVGDGLHGNAYPHPELGVQPCDFTAPGLQYNYNNRNLLTLQALDVVRRVVVDGAAAPDGGVAAEPGAVTTELPDIDVLPFSHAADTSQFGATELDAYPSCDDGQDESGPEHVYRLVLTETTPLRALVLDRGDTDVDLHLLGETPAAAACIARHDRILERTLPAGVYHLVVDTFVGSTGPRAGAYQLVVQRCESGDPDCS